MAEIVDAERREIVGRECLQREAGRPAGDAQPSLLAVKRKLDIGFLGQLAHDIVQHVGGHGGCAAALGPARQCLDQFHIEVRRRQPELILARIQQHIGEDGDCIAPLDHARHMGKRLGQAGLIDGHMHAFKPANRLFRAPAR